jgi:hypothetical protein
MQFWFHETPDGTPWIIASWDFVVDDCIHDTLRVDFDGKRILGGWSPACLNWDDGVAAEEAGIDTSPPDGIVLEGTPEELAEAAIRYFEDHIARWATSDRADPDRYSVNGASPVATLRKRLQSWLRRVNSRFAR